MFNFSSPQPSPQNHQNSENNTPPTCVSMLKRLKTDNLWFLYKSDSHFLYIFLLFMYEHSKGLGGKIKKIRERGKEKGKRKTWKIEGKREIKNRIFYLLVLVCEILLGRKYDFWKKKMKYIPRYIHSNRFIISTELPDGNYIL